MPRERGMCLGVPFRSAAGVPGGRAVCQRAPGPLKPANGPSCNGETARRFSSTSSSFLSQNSKRLGRPKEVFAAVLEDSWDPYLSFGLPWAHLICPGRRFSRAASLKIFSQFWVWVLGVWRNRQTILVFGGRGTVFMEREEKASDDQHSG